MDKANILLVDDRPENLLVLHGVLAPFEQNLVSARNADEALKHLLTMDFALILLDVEMPSVSGYELASLIRSRSRTSIVPIIFITGINKDDSQVLYGYKSGAVDYLFKPFNPEILRSKVSVFLALYEQRRQIQRQAEQLRLGEMRELKRRAQERTRVARSRSAKKAEARQEAFLMELLSSITGGKLRLCRRPSDLPRRAAMIQHPVQIDAGSTADMRDLARLAAVQCDFDAERRDDLTTSVSEAVMNAIVHGGGGIGRVGVGEDAKTVQVWVQDQGTGIAVNRLSRAVFERGYSTSGTFGHGFWLMLQLIDRIWLMSGPRGTTVVLEQDRTSKQPLWLGGDWQAEIESGSVRVKSNGASRSRVRGLLSAN